VRYQQGDTQAFEELYRRYFPRLQLYCLRRVGDRHISEELAQEAFLRAMKAMPRFAGDRRFYPWMTVIAQRLCIDHHRRSARVEPSADIDLGSVEPDHDALFAAVDHAQLGEAMARVAPRHREVLELREQHGWSYHQIADHLDVPVTTVEALLHRARKALRREFLAVSNGTRLAGIPIIGWAVLGLARVRHRMAVVGAQNLAPIAGGAAASIVAIGLALAPTTAPSTQPVQTATPTAVSSSAKPVTTAPPAVVSPAEAPAVASGPAGAAPAKAAPAAAPAPAVNAGVAQVYGGSDGTNWAADQNAQQPAQVDLGPALAVGADPEQAVDDLLKHLPGGKS
jgi:RNA polymerase sigma-70 factor (ECF subfamily)